MRFIRIQKGYLFQLLALDRSAVVIPASSESGRNPIDWLVMWSEGGKSWLHFSSAFLCCSFTELGFSLLIFLLLRWVGWKAIGTENILDPIFEEQQTREEPITDRNPVHNAITRDENLINSNGVNSAGIRSFLRVSTCAQRHQSNYPTQHVAESNKTFFWKLKTPPRFVLSFQFGFSTPPGTFTTSHFCLLHALRHKP